MEQMLLGTYIAFIAAAALFMIIAVIYLIVEMLR